MTVVQYNPPDKTALNATAGSALRMVEAFTIQSDEDYALGAEELTAIKGKLAMLEEQRTTITGPLNQAVKAVNDLFRGPREALEKAEGIIKGKLLTFRQAREREAAALRAKAEADARAERERLERVAAEQRAAAAAATSERERAEAEARAAEAETTRELVSAPTAVVDIVPRAAGVSVAKGRDVEVEDLRTFLGWIVEASSSRSDLLSLVDVNMTRLRAAMRAGGDRFAMPGIKVVETSTVRSR